MNTSDGEKFCLNWNNFHNSVISQFEALKEDEDFVDVTLYSQGKCVKAHRVVLSACSTYLKNIFKEHPCEHPIIILDNLSHNNLQALIQFVYTGQVYVELTELTSFLKAAETLQIKGLFESGTSESLINECKAEIQNSSVKICKKIETNFESEIKKRNKRKVEKNASCEQKENMEFKDNEKDAFQTNNPQAESESSTLITDFKKIGKYEYNERSVDDSGGGKRAHWLDPRFCPLCNKMYSNLSNLRQHMKIMHNPTLVTCKICAKTFKTDLYLRRHLVGFHALDGNEIESLY